MEKSRFEILSQLVEKDPKDSLARYGLALEYAKREEYDKAMENFRKLWELNPDYAAAYFQAGQMLAKTGQRGEARQVLAKGIAAARRTGDLHTQSEMEAALAEL